MIQNLHHIGIAVEDMTRSLAFYQDKLGATVALDISMDMAEFGNGVGIANAKARIVFLQIPGMSSQLELLQYTSPAGKRVPDNSAGNSIGRIHAALQVSDIKRVYESLSAKGVQFVSKPSIFPADHPVLGGIGFCYFRDPDGALLELIQLPQ